MLVYQIGRARDNGTVELELIRRENLQAVERQVGGRERLLEITGRSDAQLSQLIGKNPSRNIGKKLARSLETELGLDKGALDRPHGHTDTIDKAVDILRRMDHAGQEQALSVLSALSKAS